MLRWCWSILLSSHSKPNSRIPIMAPLSLAISLFLHFSILIITITFPTTVVTATSTTSGGRNKPNAAPLKDLVQTSCAHATYPNICLRTLSSYSNQTHNPNDLAKAAVKISLIKARKTSDYMVQLRSQSKRREKDPLRDCVEQIGDCVDELSKTLSELQNLRGGDSSGGGGRRGGGGSSYRWRMSNVQTWVSAALTNEYTCLDGFKEVDGKVRSDVKEKITEVARVTSNALYLINRL